MFNLKVLEMSNPKLKHLILVFLLALSIRLLYNALTPSRPLTVDDSTQWIQTANRFSEGKGFLTETEGLDPKRAPIYPLFISMITSLFGPNLDLVKIAQSILGSLNCILIYYLSSHTLGTTIALWSSLICTLYPPFIVYSGILMSETLFTFLLLFFLLLFTKLLLKPYLKIFIGAGLFLGIANLCRGTLLLFPVFLLLLPLLIKDQRKWWLKYILLIAINFSIIFPWTWRNYKVYGGFMPVASGGSELLWFGTLPWTEQRLFGNAPSFQKLNLINNPIKNEQLYFKNALNNIILDPTSYFFLTIKKFIFFWFKPVGQKLTHNKFPIIGQLLFYGHALFIFLTIAGIFYSRQFWKNLLPIYLIIIYFSLLHTILAPEPRYRLPIEPLMILFTVQALYSMIQLYPKKFATTRVGLT